MDGKCRSMMKVICCSRNGLEVSPGCDAHARIKARVEVPQCKGYPAKLVYDSQLKCFDGTRRSFVHGDAAFRLYQRSGRILPADLPKTRRARYVKFVL